MSFLCSTEWFQAAVQVIVLGSSTTQVTHISQLEMPPDPGAFVFYCTKLPEKFGLNAGQLIVYP